MKRERVTPHLTQNALKVLESRYFLRDARGEVAETAEGLFRRVAKVVAAAERRHGASPAQTRAIEEDFYRAMALGEFMPNTPTLMNAGAPLGQLSACFVIPVGDSVDSIFDALKATAEIHKSGGGTGFDFSPIRPKGDLVRSTGGRASGPVSFMRIFDTVTDVIKQGGKRRGANMGILRIDHPDILEFIEAKTEKGALKNFNISAAATDAFMRAVMAGKTFRLRNPRTGTPAGEKSAREVFGRIIEAAWRTGDPGMIFLDAINRRNPTRHLGPIASTNPCGEVPLHPWESCNLGSINLAKTVAGDAMRGRMDWAKLSELTQAGVRFLDDIIDANRYPLPEIERATKANRRIGLGVMGLAEAFIHLGIPYDSKEALSVGRSIMAFIEKEARTASERLGKERGSFPNFKGSLWRRKGYRHMRNATATTIAPTGTISIIAGCSSGIEPLFAVSFVRNVLDGARLVETAPLFERIARGRGFWSEELALTIAKTGSVQDIKAVPDDVKRLFKTALEIGVEQHVRMQAAFQAHVDNAVSKTINLPEAASEDDVRRAYLLAWKLKCKGITVYRYGSKPDQVLTVGPYERQEREIAVSAESEFAGGCPAGVCAYHSS